jgi:hypothetical protein
MIAWEKVGKDNLVRAIHEYDKLGAERLVWEKRKYPPKAIVGSRRSKLVRRLELQGRCLHAMISAQFRSFRIWATMNSTI